MTAEEFAALVPGARRNPSGGYVGRCRAHDDQRASLSWRDGDTHMLLTCHAGCTFEAIVTAFGVSPEQLRRRNGHTPTPGREVAAYDYTDAGGALLYQAVRYEPKDFRCRRPDGAGGWAKNLDGVRVVPYRLPELAEAPRVYVVEGEKDADALSALGLVATCNHGGAGKWRAEHTAALVAAAVPEVVVLRDHDAPGERHAAQVAAALVAGGLRVKRLNLWGTPLPAKHGRDVSDWLAEGHIAAELQALADAAPVLEPDAAPGPPMLITPAGEVWPAPEPVPNDLPDIESATAAPYTFAPVVPAGHFLADYITYGASRTDAAHEYHEAAGLTLLAAATPNVRAELSPYPGGLGTNLYVLLVGDSTRSRKSTAAAIADDLHDAVIPGGRLAELTSPEALIEQLAARPADAATWFVDEMGDLLDKLHHAKHLAGLRGLLLTVYAGRDYRYARHSKRTKGGAKVEDADEIRAPHLSVFGATTPGVFDILTSADVRSGLLPRFAIVMPQAKPDRMPFYGGAGWGEARQAPLTAALHRPYVWAKAARRPVTFDAGALERLDAFAEALERAAGDHDESIRTMLHRLAPMALKVAMLLAAGQPTTPDRDGLMVSLSDAEAAVIIAGRWRADAVAFASRIGETEFERTVARCLRVFQTKAGAGKAVPRRAIAQNVHVSKRVLDDVEGTLQDRGEIHVSRIEIPGRPDLHLWELPGA